MKDPTTNDRIRELAKDMEVQESDVKCLMSGVINCMGQDEMIDHFFEMKQEDQIHTIEAYIIAACKRFEKFQADMLTNDEKRKSFVRLVYTLT
jgi:hypothetical protein